MRLKLIAQRAPNKTRHVKPVGAFGRLNGTVLLGALAILTAMLAGCDSLIGSLGGGATVSGTVKAPETQTAAIIANNAYRISGTLATETAVSGAEVRAYNSSGAEIVGAAAVKSASNGGFEIKGLPSGRTVRLVATAKAKNGGTLTLSALIKPGGVSAVRDLNTASTVVAEKLKATLSSEKIDALVQSDVDSLEDTVSANMATADIPDLTLAGSAVASFDKVKSKSTQVSAGFQAITGSQNTASVR